jgi:hypothetical protein
MKQKYIDKQIPSFKIICNDILDAFTCIRQPYIQYTPTRGGPSIMNHTSLIFSRTITKITIPIELTPYLQITTIANKPLNPMIIIRIYVYMTTHEEDIHIIPHIHHTFKQILTTHSTYFPILIGDFNRDIFLIGYHNQHSITQLTN